MPYSSQPFEYGIRLRPCQFQDPMSSNQSNRLGQEKISSFWVPENRRQSKTWISLSPRNDTFWRATDEKGRAQTRPFVNHDKKGENQNADFTSSLLCIAVPTETYLINIFLVVPSLMRIMLIPFCWAVSLRPSIVKYDFSVGSVLMMFSTPVS